MRESDRQTDCDRQAGRQAGRQETDRETDREKESRNENDNREYIRRRGCFWWQLYIIDGVVKSKTKKNRDEYI